MQVPTSWCDYPKRLVKEPWWLLWGKSWRSNADVTQWKLALSFEQINWFGEALRNSPISAYNVIKNCVQFDVSSHIPIYSKMCVDYRALNSYHQKSFPNASSRKSYMEACRYKFITTLAMLSGFYQIPLKEECKPSTAFFTPDGLFEQNVMPIGLRNVPMFSQEMIVRLIASLRYCNKIISYVKEIEIMEGEICRETPDFKEILS